MATATPIPATDTLRVALPPSLGPVSAAGARAALGAFGAVAKVQMLPSRNERIALATYFDVRDAASAAEALGDRCYPEAEQGQRVVWLPADFSLQPEQAAGVKDLYPDPAENGGFILEFYDVRCAAKIIEAGMGAKLYNSTASEVEEVSEDWMKAGRTQPLAATQKPPGLECLGTDAYYGGDSAVVATSSTVIQVIIRGLPNALCNKECMEAVLQQAGLAGDVKSCVARPGETCGEARVALRGHEALSQCVRHFQGMQWDEHIPVSVIALGPTSGVPSKPKSAVNNLRGKSWDNSWAQRAMNAPEWLPCATESKRDWALKTESSTEAESAEEDVRSNGSWYA